MKTRQIRDSIKTNGKAKSREDGVKVDSIKKNPVGRPKKHGATQSKTFRLPLFLIEAVEKNQLPGESLTDSFIRYCQIGLIM